MTTFNLPDLGEGLTEATLLSWLVAEGEVIVVDQPIAEVETAKSSIEVPSPYAGTVIRLHGAVGDTLIVEEPLITVGTAGDDGASGDTSTGDTSTEAQRTTSIAEGGEAGQLSYRQEEQAGVAPAAEEAEGSGNVLIGYGTSTSGTSRRRRRRRNGVPSAQSVGTTAAEPGTEESAAAVPRRAPRVSSPLVRRLARDHAVALAEISGSGPDGLIVRSDVLAAKQPAEQPTQQVAAHVADQPAAAAPPQTSARTSPETRPAAEAAHPTPAGLEVRDRVPMTGMRKAVATTLARSRREIPEATVWQDVDMTELVALRARLKEQASIAGRSAPSVLALLGRFVLAGLATYPELATQIRTDEHGEQEILHFDGVNLGFAAQTDAGLVVPVVRHAERLSARQLHEQITRLVGAAREGGLSGRELTGGTFTVNNYGVFGSDGATPIINHPEVAILGIGRIIDRPWAVDGELVVRKVSTLTLAFDHRVCDGGTAGGFLNFVATCLEDPASALADL